MRVGQKPRCIAIGASVVLIGMAIGCKVPSRRESPKPQPASSPAAESPKATPKRHAAKRHAAIARKTPELTDEEQLAASLSNLKQGNLFYKTPEKLKTGQTGHVKAQIGSNEVPDDAAGLQAGKNSAVGKAQTPISPAMRMTLKSADFDITPLSSEEQAVGGRTPTTWEWDIIPKHSGRLRLHLAATVVLKNLSRDFTAVDREIAVEVDAVGAAEKFVGANWGWFAATLTAIGGALLKLLSDRKKAKAAAGEVKN